MKNKNQLTDDEKAEMIKSHLFESLDVLKELEVKKEFKEIELPSIQLEEQETSMMHPINILEGLTQTQIEIIKSMTKTHNLIPLGWSVDVKTGNMYYMGKFICSTQPIIESESFSQPIIENSLSKGEQK